MKFLGVDQHIVRYQDKTFFEKRALLVDSTFLQVFPYELKEGDPNRSLDAPSSALISEKLSGRIFGGKSPLDQFLIINSGQSVDTFRVTGVVATPKYPSHVDADLYLSMNSNGLGSWLLAQTTWANNNLVESYLKLQNPQDYKALESKLAQQLDLHAGEELRASGRAKELSLQPLDKIRLYSNFTRPENKGAGNITYIYIAGTIGILILLLACINFMNLTTAKAAQRAGEVGVRKSMGAFRGNLVRQFMGESMVIVFFALLLAFVMVIVVLPTFNTVMMKELSLNTGNLLIIILAGIAICLVTGVLGGSYPAFFLSSLVPAHVLKSKSITTGSQWVRRSLVVFQFVITITLISSIVIMQKQLRFIQSTSLGFDREQVVMIPLRTPAALQAYRTLKTEFARMNGVKMVSGTSSIPSTPLHSDWGIYKKGSTNDQSVHHENVWVDADYFKALNIPLVAGRDFNTDVDNVPGDSTPWKIIVNESSLKALDLSPDEAVGASVFFEPGSGERYEYHIVGVVKDFHQFSLHRQITPMTLILPPDRSSFQYMAMSVNMDEYKSLEGKMKATWDGLVNDIPFESVFLNDNLKNLYKSDMRMSTLLAISTIIALIISCFGLYGLSVYVAERKTKEIGIRKVVGASVTSIVSMLSKEYLILVAFSFILAVPLGYYAMDKWLQSFAYKIELGLSVFIIAGILAFMIAWLTVSFESFRAARRNPAETLKGD
jgi:putative ABC transport system permease protein